MSEFRSWTRSLGVFALGIALAFVILLVLIPSAQAVDCFPDVSGDYWAHDFICWVKNNGIASGYPDGTYRPENNVTRAEMAVFVQQVAGHGSAGPVTNADQLDGYDAGSFAFGLAEQALATSFTDVLADDGDASWTEVTKVSLSFPDECTGSFPNDKHDAIVFAKGVFDGDEAVESFIAHAALGLDGNQPIVGSRTHSIVAPTGVRDRISFATVYLFTGLSSGSHSFSLVAANEDPSQYASQVHEASIVVQRLGWNCE